MKIEARGAGGEERFDSGEAKNAAGMIARVCTRRSNDTAIGDPRTALTPGEASATRRLSPARSPQSGATVDPYRYRPDRGSPIAGGWWAGASSRPEC